ISDDDLPLRTLLGLTRQDEAVGDLRQLQIAPLRGRGALRLLLNGGMALVAGFTMMMETAWPVVVGWLLVTLAFSIWSFRTFDRLPLDDPKFATAAELRLCHRHALYSALLWGGAFWLQGPTPTLDHVLSLWTIALLLMLALTMVAHSMPLTCILYIAPVTLS